MLLENFILERVDIYNVLCGIGRSRGMVEDGDVSALVSGYRLYRAVGEVKSADAAL